MPSGSMPVAGNTERTQPENRAFFPALDGLRAVAFLMVLLQHYMQMPWGWTGVNVFFVLSGFLITGILFDTRDTTHRFRNFYIRRTLRIFPLYYGIFVVLVLLYPIFHWRWSAVFLAWPLYLGNFLRFLSHTATTRMSQLYIAANGGALSGKYPWVQLRFGHFWSLCVEEQFYLVWPAVVFGLRSRRRLMVTCAAVVVLVPLLRLWAQHTAPQWLLQQELLYRVTPFQVDSLLLGGLVALLWRGAHREKLLQIGKLAALVLAIVAATYVGVIIAHAWPRWRVEYPYPEWRFTWGLLYINVLSAAVIVCCLRPGGWVQRMLSVRPLRWTGRISYGAYVFHDVFHDAYGNWAQALAAHFNRNASGSLIAIIALAATLAIAWLSFKFFESPFLNLKEKWTRA